MRMAFWWSADEAAMATLRQLLSSSVERLKKYVVAPLKSGEKELLVSFRRQSVVLTGAALSDEKSRVNATQATADATYVVGDPAAQQVEFTITLSYKIAGAIAVPVAASRNKCATCFASNCSTHRAPCTCQPRPRLGSPMEHFYAAASASALPGFYQRPMRDHLRNGRGSRRHYGLQRDHTFQQHDPETFLYAWQAEDVASIVFGGEYGARNVAQPNHRAREIQVAREPMQRGGAMAHCRRSESRYSESDRATSPRREAARPRASGDRSGLQTALRIGRIPPG